MARLATFLVICCLVVSLSSFGKSALYTSNSTHILKVNSDTGSQEIIVSSEHIGRVVGIAVDIADNYLFWSDINRDKQGIYRSDLNGNNIQLIYTPNGLSEVNGLSVDWVHKHVYFTDASQRTVEVMDYDGSNRRLLIDSNLMIPRGIYADPENNYLFWNDQGSQRIERSRLDGSDRTLLMHGSPRWPNQMVVKSGKLFWVDGWNKSLSSMSLNGQNFEIVTELPSVTAGNPVFGLTSSVGKFYISAWHQGLLSVQDSNGQIANVANDLGTDAIFSIATDDSTSQSAGVSKCGNSHGCSNLCLPTASSYRCSCPSFSGVTLSSDGKRCEEPYNILLFALADNGQVAYKDLDGADTPDHYLVARSLRPIAVGYDPIDKVVYWSDVNQRNIQRANLDGTNHEVFLNSSHSVGIVDGLTVDYVNRRLYFSNMGFVMIDSVAYTWHKIEMIGLDGTDRKIAVTNVEKPRGLSIDIQNRYLYYTDWGTVPKVIRTELDGSNPKTIQSGLQNPNAVLLSDNQLYVVDSNYEDSNKNGSLFSSSAGGDSWTENPTAMLQIPFGLAKHNEKIYVSDWGSNSIVSVPGMETVLSGYGTPAGLFATRVDIKPPANVACQSSQCADMCIPEPASMSSQQSTCSCDTYSTDIQGILSTSSQCSVANSFLLFADMNSIKTVSLDDTQDHSPYTVIQGDSYFSNFAGLALDPDNDVIYFSDVNRRVIFKSNADGTDVQVFYEPDHVIDGMTVSSGRVYWTSFQKGVISSVAISGDNSTYSQVVSGLQKPRAVLVDETGGFVYWTEWGMHPRVARKPIAGGNIEPVIDSDLGWPNGLHLDTTRNLLYVADGLKNAIFKYNVNDQSVEELSLNLNQHVKHVYDIVAFDNYLYLTSWNMSGVYVVDLMTGDFYTVAADLMRPTQLFMKKPTSDPLCSVDIGCSDTCKYVPGTDMFCTCPSGQVLTADKKTCSGSTSGESTTGIPHDTDTPVIVPGVPRFTNCPASVVELILPEGENSRMLPFTLEAKDANNVPLTVVGNHGRKFTWKAGEEMWTVRATATDQSGQAVVCEFQVLVKDLVPPSIIYCTADVESLTSKDKKALYFQPPVFGDNVKVTKVVGSAMPGQEFPVGSHQITYTASDGSGNTVDCKFVISVKKTTLTCSDPAIPNNGELQCSGSPQTCTLKCRDSYERDPRYENSYTCQSDGKWSPAFSDGFSALACYKVFVPKELTLTLNATLIGSCKNPVDSFINDLKTFVIGKMADNNLCNSPDITLCNNDHLQVSCGNIVKRRRRAENEILLTITIHTSFNNTEAALEAFQAILDLFSQLQSYFKSNAVNDLNNSNVAGQTLLYEGQVNTANDTTCRDGQVKIRGQCTKCSVGSRYDSVSKQCEPCEKNTYQHLEGQTSCIACDNGMTAPAGSFVKEQCSVAGPADVVSLPLGVVIGVVVGILVLIIIGIIVTIVIVRRRKPKPNDAGMDYHNPAYEENETRRRKNGDESHYEKLSFDTDNYYDDIGEAGLAKKF